MRVSFCSGRLVSFAATLFALAAFAVVASPASAQLVYTESLGSVAGGRFGVLNLVTGEYELRGTRTTLLSGLAVSPTGVLYGSTTTNQLYTVNPLNGQLTLRGNLGLSGSQITSIAFASNGSLYGLLSSNATGNATLLRINNFAAGTLSTTSLGSLGFLSNGALAGDASGNLYATAGDIAASGYGSLFRVSTSGGAATSLSPFNDAGFFAPAYAMSFSSSTNTLFAVDKGTDESGFGTEGTIYAVDRASGEATQTASYNSGTVGNVFAISNAFVIPESSTFALLLPALALLVGTPLVRTQIARRRIG